MRYRVNYARKPKLGSGEPVIHRTAVVDDLVVAKDIFYAMYYGSLFEAYSVERKTDAGWEMVK